MVVLPLSFSSGSALYHSRVRHLLQCIFASHFPLICSRAKNLGLGLGRFLQCTFALHLPFAAPKCLAYFIVRKRSISGLGKSLQGTGLGRRPSRPPGGFRGLRPRRRCCASPGLRPLPIPPALPRKYPHLTDPCKPIQHKVSAARKSPSPYRGGASDYGFSPIHWAAGGWAYR